MSSFLMRYSILYELNTLDACWIAVDVWSNSSRCRQELVYLSQTWCLYTWSCLDNLIIIRFSINCSTVICSSTVILMLSWEKPLVKPMAPGSIFHHINLPLFLLPFILQSLLLVFIIKYQKYYLIISIWSHFCKWPWRDWQPLYYIGCEFLFVCVGAWNFWGASYWIDTLVLKNWGKYLRYYAASSFPLQGNPTQCSRGSIRF